MGKGNDDVRRGLTALLSFLLLLGIWSGPASAAKNCRGRALTPTTEDDGVIRGTGGDDVILGSNGDDTILGLGGADVLCGGGGNDRIAGGPGRDEIEGDAGNDRITGGDGSDYVYGGRGADTLSGGEDADFVFGQGSSDKVNGGPGADHVSGGNEDDRVEGGDGRDRLEGDEGSDRLIADGNDDIVHGSSQSLISSSGFDILDLSENPTGVDLTGVQQFQIDRIIGSQHDDKIIGAANLSSDAGQDLQGRGGNDEISPHEFGPPSPVQGGGGTDEVIYTTEVIVDLAAGTATAVDATWSATLSSIEDVTGHGLLLGDEGPNKLTVNRLGPDGVGTGVEGGGGDDRLFGYRGADRIAGGPGDDVIKGIAGNYLDILVATDGDDTLSGDGGDDTIYGGKGNDFIQGGAGNDQLFGMNGPADGLAHENDTNNIDGGDGTDVCGEAAEIQNCEPVETCPPGDRQASAFRSLQGACDEKIVWSRLAVDDDGTDSEIFSINPDGTGRRALTTNRAHDQDPELSPDGSKIVFVRFTAQGGADLFVMDSDGSDIVRLTDTPDHELQPTWSPDGTKIAYTGVPGDEEPGVGAVQSNVFVLAGEVTTQLTNEDWIAGRYADSPTWSPDGSQIAYVGTTPSNPSAPEINVVNASGGGHRVVTSTDPADGSHYGNLQWSPDGSTFLFHHCYISLGSCVVHTVGADGDIAPSTGYSVWRALTPGGAIHTQPSWSPYGSRVSTMPGTGALNDFDISTMNADGSAPTRLFTDAREDLYADWGYYYPPID